MKDHPIELLGEIDGRQIDRRTFTLESAMALLAGAAITITACDGDDGPTAPAPGPAGAMGSVSANHGHRATINSAQLTAGNAIELNIRGDATHPHVVELTGNEVTNIGEGDRVSKASSTDAGHNHTVMFN